MEIVKRATVFFPVAPERQNDVNNVFTENGDGFFTVWDAKDNPVCYCPTFESAEFVSILINTNAPKGESITLEMRF